MSYRAFKRLLGETSLERKCRFLLGAGILVLITASFWLYAHQTEYLAYDVTASSGRLLVPGILAKIHIESPQRVGALDEFQRQAEKQWPEVLSKHDYRLYMPNATGTQNQPQPDEVALLKSFLDDPNMQEDSRRVPGRSIYYYGAIRASASCVGCHRDPARVKQARPELGEGDLIALARVHLPIDQLEDGLHVNRALLISIALATSLLVMAASFLIIRYVVVKPVKHLKEVSDAISAGKLNVRSEIQTGDEFEDFSHAFNRMLRNLFSVQDRLTKVNADLDHKVDELASTNLALYESNRVKSEFLATMSHELRTPLHIINGFSDLLAQAQLPDRQARWAANIQKGGKELLDLVEDILATVKLEAGKMQIRPEEFPVSELAESELALIRPLAEKKNIDLRGTVAADVPPLYQDIVKVRQILKNLLSNAIKFTPEGGRVSLSAQRDGGDVLLVVGDTGVGVAPEDRDVIFEKFRQAANTLTREHSGSGLGLSISRELAKLLGGDITLQSEVGRGSTFAVRLPVRLHAADPADPAARPVAAEVGA